MTDNCGPLHDNGCACEYACPDCRGAVEEDNHVCDCRHCDYEGADEYRCVACAWVGDEHELVDVAGAQRQREETKLAEWTAWAS